jgi:hypothetical protein
VPCLQVPDPSYLPRKPQKTCNSFPGRGFPQGENPAHLLGGSPWACQPPTLTEKTVCEKKLFDKSLYSNELYFFVEKD